MVLTLTENSRCCYVWRTW